MSGSKISTETPRNLPTEKKTTNSSLRKSSKQSRNKHLQSKIDIARTMKQLESTTKGSIQIITTDIKSPVTRNLGKTVLTKQFTADRILDSKSLNEVMTGSFRPGAKLILKNIKTMLNEDTKHKKNKKLKNLATRIKETIDKYKEREELLVKENIKLRNQVKHLVKTLAVYEMFT